VNKRKKQRKKKAKSGKAIRLRASQVGASRSEQEQKLSERIKEMAIQLLKQPEAIPTEPAFVAALMIATAAWNIATGFMVPRDEYRKTVDQIDWGSVEPWAELRSNDIDKLVAELVEYKKERFPNDRRRLVGTEMSPEGNIRVHWTEPDKVVAAQFGSRSKDGSVAKQKHGHPIADKIVRYIKKGVHGNVVNLSDFITGRKNAEELQKTVVSKEELAEYHPAHAVYVHTQNQVSVMAEQLSVLKEMDRFSIPIDRAMDDYMPSGPPWSPLTTSFFTCWAFFDVCIGTAEETIGTTVMTVGRAFGMSDELIRVMRLMQDSRMGIYVNEGSDNGAVMLRELVTNVRCRAIATSGYLGRKGELWYARVLPPPLPILTEYVVFTTPYVLVSPDEREWQAYFRRTLPDAPLQDRIRRYERHMKFGPTTRYWTEFVFEAYVNHQTDVIFLEGLPDIPESRPHSGSNS